MSNFIIKSTPSSSIIVYPLNIQKNKPTFISSDTGGVFYTRTTRYKTTAQHGSQPSKDILINNLQVY